MGGLSTAEIARAFLVPEATMTRRITRAKRKGKRRQIVRRFTHGRQTWSAFSAEIRRERGNEAPDQLAGDGS